MNIFDAPKGSIRTNSGIFITVFDPKPEMITIEDIAHALASVPRFGGHLNRPYSVAQHSVMCMMRVKSLEDKKAALMHDASEAYMGDIPTPIKAMLPEYKKAENNLMQIIADKFGFEFPLSKEVKAVDEEMLHIEWKNLVMEDNRFFECWDHQTAKETFLKAYELLFVDTIVV